MHNTLQKTLHRYLQHATRGLPRQQRQEVWQELEMDILEQASHHRSFGLTEQQALEKVLQQLGAPSTIQQGMHRVYTLPRVGRWGAGFLAAGMVLLAASSSTRAELSITNQPPLPYCKHPEDMHSKKCLYRGIDAHFSWVEVDSLMRELRAAGIKTENRNQQLQMHFPEKTVTVSLQHRFVAFSPVAFEREGKTYLQVNQLLTRLRHSLNVPMTLTGLNNPTLKVGKLTLKLPHHNAYADLAGDLANHLIQEQGFSSVGYGSRTSKAPDTTTPVHGPVKTGVVYAMVVKTPTGNLAFDLAEGQQDGTVHFYNGFEPQRKYRAVHEFKQLSAYPSKGRYPALVLELTGVLNSPGQPYRVVTGAQFD